LQAKGQKSSTFAVGQETEVADAHEAFGSKCNWNRRKNWSSGTTPTPIEYA
jgi:hypothetical protein